jgi:hypothetical protein
MDDELRELEGVEIELRQTWKLDDVADRLRKARIGIEEHMGKPKRRMRLGGLMRCCIQTIQESPGLREIEGTIIACEHCHEQIRFREKAWEWAHDLPQGRSKSKERR